MNSFGAPGRARPGMDHGGNPAPAPQDPPPRPAPLPRNPGGHARSKERRSRDSRDGPSQRVRLAHDEHITNRQRRAARGEPIPGTMDAIDQAVHLLLLGPTYLVVDEPTVRVVELVVRRQIGRA